MHLCHLVSPLQCGGLGHLSSAATALQPIAAHCSTVAPASLPDCFTCITISTRAAHASQKGLQDFLDAAGCLVFVCGEGRVAGLNLSVLPCSSLMEACCQPHVVFKVSPAYVSALPLLHAACSPCRGE